MDQVSIQQSNRPRKTHCIRGHERTPENVDSTNHCHLCRALEQRERRSNAQTCTNGHLWTSENTIEANGFRKCRICVHRPKPTLVREYCLHGHYNPEPGKSCIECQKLYNETPRGKALRRDVYQRYRAKDIETFNKRHRDNAKSEEARESARERERQRATDPKYRKIKYESNKRRRQTTEYKEYMREYGREYRRRKREQATQQ